MGFLFSAFLAFRLATLGEVQLRGRRILNSALQAKREMRAEAGGCGIRVHPLVPLSRERETRGLLLLGNPGSGKTVILTSALDQIFARGDRLIVHDLKGDFTARFLNHPSVQLLAPWDERSARWSAAADIATLADARSLSERLIESSSDPMWSQAARQILTGLLMHLVIEKAGDWSFADLVELVATDYEQLRTAALAGNPSASQLLPAEPNKTTQSVLANLIAFMAPVSDLARSESTGYAPISIREWMLDPRKSGPQMLLVGNNQRYGTLGRAFAQSIFDVVRQTAVGPELQDDKERRIWVVLDEAPQLGKIDGLASLVETGRSRGICTIVGLQDIAQWRHIYSRDEADALSSMLGTHIYCRLSPGETAKYLSDAIGQREVLRPMLSTSDFDSYGQKASLQRQRIVEPVVAPEEFGQLGVSKQGVEALFLTGRETVYRLTWPFPPKAKNPALANIAAKWTSESTKTESEIKKPPPLLSPPAPLQKSGPVKKADTEGLEQSREEADILDDLFGDEDGIDA